MQISDYQLRNNIVVNTLTIKDNLKKAGIN
jgi:hypothetical protein